MIVSVWLAGATPSAAAVMTGWPGWSSPYQKVAADAPAGITTEVTGGPPAVAENSSVPAELEDSWTVIPLVTGVPSAAVSWTVIGPRDGLDVAAPVTAGDVKASSAPAAIGSGAGSPPAAPPGDPWAPVARFRPVFLALSAVVRAAARAAAAVTTSNEWPSAGGASAGLTELEAVSW